MKQPLSKSLFLIVLLFGLAQCGEIGTLSKDVSAKFIPENPVVVNTDLTYYDSQGEEVTIKGPWYIMGSSIYNGTLNRLYLVNYSLKGSTTDNGVTKRFEFDLDPGVAPCEDRAYLAILDSYETYERVNSCDPDDPLSGGVGAGRYESWYYHGLPDSDNYIYNVEIIANGWFVDSDDVPIERLYLSGFISTQ